MNAANRPPRWSDISKSERFQAADPETRRRVRDSFFDDVISPNLPDEQRLNARMEFYEAANSDIEPPSSPGIISQAADAAAGLGRSLAAGVPGSVAATTEGTGVLLQQMDNVESDRLVQEAEQRLETVQQRREEALAATTDEHRGRVQENYDKLLRRREQDFEEAVTQWANRSPNQAAEWLRARGVDLKALSEQIDVPPEERTWANDLAGGVGSMVTYLGPGMLVGALSRGSAAAGMATSLGMAMPAGVSEAYGRAIQGGLDEEQAIERAMAGALPGAIQVAPLASLLRPLPPEMRGKAIGQLYSILRTGGAEATVEGAGAVLQNLIEQSYNPERGTWDDAAYQAMIGGGAGGVVQASTQLATRGQGMNADAAQEEGVPEPRPQTPPDTDPATQDSVEGNAEWERRWQAQGVENPAQGLEGAPTIEIVGTPEREASTQPETFASEPAATVAPEQQDQFAALIEADTQDPALQRARENLIMGEGYAALRRNAEGNAEATNALEQMQRAAFEADAAETPEQAAELRRQASAAYQQARASLNQVESTQEVLEPNSVRIERARQAAAAQGGDALEQAMAGESAEQAGLAAEAQAQAATRPSPAASVDIGARIQQAMGELDDLQTMARGSHYQGQNRLRNISTILDRAERAYEAGNTEQASRLVGRAQGIADNLRDALSQAAQPGLAAEQAQPAQTSEAEQEAVMEPGNAESGQGLQYRASGQPFPTERAAMMSGYARNAQRNNQPVAAVPVAGGFALDMSDQAQPASQATESLEPAAGDGESQASQSLQYRTNGSPFATPRAAMMSRFASEARANNQAARPVRVDGGYALEIRSEGGSAEPFAADAPPEAQQQEVPQESAAATESPSNTPPVEASRSEAEPAGQRDEGPGSTAWQRAEAKGLDLSQNARMQRAREMGYISAIDDAIAGEVNSDGQVTRRRDQEGRNGRRNDAASGDARPLTVYHGTAGDIDGFQRGHRDQYDAGWLGQGIYVTTNPEQANVYAEKKSRRLNRGGDNVLPLHIKPSALLKLPADAKRRLAQAGPEATQAFSESLKRHGYDGVIVEYGDTQEVVLFNESDIRSTQAAFDPDGEGSNDLLFSTRETGEDTWAGADNAPLAADIKAALAGMPELADARVIQSASALPPEALIGMVLRGVNPRDVRGMFVGGDLYVVADNVASIEEGVRTAVHEAVGHKGVRGVLGDELDTVMRQVYRSLPLDRRGREALDEVLESYPFLDQSNPEHQITIAEEMIAHLAEKGWQPGVIKRAIGRIRELLRKAFPNMRWTDADVMQLSERSREYLRRQQEESQASSGSTGQPEDGAGAQGEPDQAASADDGARFSLGKPDSTPSAEQLAEVLNGEVGLGKPAIVDTKDQLDLDTLLMLTVRGIDPDSTVAFTHNDRLHIIAGNAESASAAKEAALLEQVRQKGLHHVLGDKMATVATNAYGKMPGNRSATRVMRAVRAEYSHLDSQNKRDRHAMMTEVISRMMARGNPPSFIQDAHDRLKALMQERGVSDISLLGRANSDYLNKQQLAYGKGNHQHDPRFTLELQDQPGYGTLLEMGQSVIDADGNIISDVRIDRGFTMNPLTHMGRAILSQTDRLRQADNKVLNELARRVDAYFDQSDARLGKVNGIVRPALQEMKKGGRKQRKENERLFEQYWRDWDNGRRDKAQAIYDQHPAIAKMVDASSELFHVTGIENQNVKTPNRRGMWVWDGRKKQYRRIGKVPKGEFWPRAMRRDVQEVIQQPDSNPELWGQMLDALVDGGHADNRKAAAEFLRGSEGYVNEISNDYFAGIEKARGEKLPEIFYDYSLGVVADYGYKWANRISQVEQFGQKLKPGELDAFDEAIRLAADQSTKDYITQVADNLYSRQTPSFYSEFMANANVLATGMQLGGLGTATLNLMGGTQLNVQLFGSKRVAQSYVELASDFQNIYREGVEEGVLGKDIMNLMRDSERDQMAALSREAQTGPLAKAFEKAGGKRMNTREVLREYARLSLKYGGYMGTEQIIRANAYVAARGQLRDALRLWKESPGSRDARKYQRFMQRNRIDVEALRRENGKGEETSRYMRLMVNLPQGSYRADQSPLYADTPHGRFFFKYQKFGTQVARLGYQQRLKPFIETVTDADATASEKLSAFGDLIGWVGWSMLGGNAVRAARAALYGYLYAGPDWEEIAEAWFGDEDKSLAMAWTMDMMFHNMMAGSTFGFFGNYMQLAKDVADQQRVKNPMQPPGFAALEAITNLARKTLQQDSVIPSLDDTAHEVLRNVQLVRAVDRLAASAGNAAGMEVGRFELEMKRRDHNYIRGAARRWADAAGIEARSSSWGGGGMSPNSAANRKVYEAIMLGDTRRARELIREETRGLQGEEYRNRLQSFRSSVRARSPFSLQGSTMNQEQRERFISWSRQNLPESKWIVIQREYRTFEAGVRATFEGL
ncbi:ADP-ribosyltransferase-containing protein [Vreelandella stevensii]|uniref:ADP-ribosyltransferase-containing protein n=1 Tax=Vreelandella stevensii TaxID=502821 RepID=UPI00403ABCEE